ncbi:flagellar protein FlaG [Marinobacter hydrocarbonoclasticus]|nr:flagellar protein FlaG [Marinobacter nauticus]
MSGIDSLGLSGMDPAKIVTGNAAIEGQSGAIQPVSPASPGAVSESPHITENQETGLDRSQLSQIAEELEHFIGGNQRGLSFHVDEDTGRDVVVVKDVTTDEVIRQIPAEEVLELAARLSDLTGMLVETEA